MTDQTTTAMASSVEVMASSNNLLSSSQQRLVIRASAGTGKTFQLTNRYLTLLRKSPVESILASTFTRKAAGEILQRILLRLSLAVLDQKELHELQPHLGTPIITSAECQNLLQAYTKNLHRVRISTLDGFFARLAGSFSLELGLPPGWRILEGLDAQQLQAQAIETILSEGPATDVVQLMHLLDKGNTSRSVSQLVSDKVDKFYEAYLNSDEAAWNKFPEMHFLSAEEREACIQQLANVQIEGKRLNKARDTDLQRLHNDDWNTLATAGLMPIAVYGKTYYGKELPEEIAEPYRKLFKHLQASIVIPWAHQTAATYQLLNKFHEINERIKNDAKGLMFNDVTRKLAMAIGEHTASQLAYRLDGQIDHVLLDEFQDTSLLQWKAIRPFAEKVCERIGSSFFCVGDVKQAIYGWRGGEAAIFDTIETELPDVNTQELNRSFRSSPVIMQTVNQVFRGMGEHDGMENQTSTIQTWAHQFPTHETAKENLPGYAKLLTSPFPEDYEPDGKNTKPVTDELWEFTARYVAGLSKEAPNSSIAVLTRKNGSVGKLIFLLNQLGIDASEEGGNLLTDSAAVQLILSLMRLVDHPGHTAALYHVVHSPLGAAVGLTNHLDVPRAHKFSQEFSLKLMQGYGPMVHELTAVLAPTCNSRELRRLVQLSAQADNFDASQLPLRPGRFVDFIEQQKVQEPTNSRVRVMTVHQSKGLEFDTVIAPELDELLTKPPSYASLSKSPTSPPDFIALAHSKEDFNLLPSNLQESYQQTQAKALEESLCLLYVTLTRAIHSLHLIVKPRCAKGSEKQLPKTYAGILRAGLAPNKEPKPAQTLFEIGDPNWHRLVPEKTEPPASTSETLQAAADDQLKIKFATSKDQRRVKRVAPSNKEDQRTVRLSNLLSVGNSEAMDRGTLFHQWMEQVRWIDEAQPSEDKLRRIGRELGAQHLNLDECIGQFNHMLHTPNVTWALSKESYQDLSNFHFPADVMTDLQAGTVRLEVINERPFSVMDENGLVNGSIDRLVLISRDWQILAADVIDFKTDVLPDETKAIEERVELYRSQLNAYVQAVSQIYNLAPERINARLILLSIGRVETLTPQV